MAKGDLIHLPTTEWAMDSGESFSRNGYAKIVFSDDIANASTFVMKLSSADIGGVVTSISVLTASADNLVNIGDIKTALEAASTLIDSVTIADNNHALVITTTDTISVKFYDYGVTGGATNPRVNIVGTSGQSLAVPMIYVKLIS